MASETQHVTLVADTESVLTFTQNGGQVRVTVVANPALIYVNAKDTAIPTAGGALGTLANNLAIPAVLCSRAFPDETAGALTKVRLRSLGTPTVSVTVS